MKKMMAAAAILSAVLLISCGTVNIKDFAEYEFASTYTVGDGSVAADGIERIEINWVSGNVRFERYDKDTVSFSETSSFNKKSDAIGEATENKELSESLRMRYKTDGDRLIIQYCRSGLRVREAAVRDLEKDLTVYIPDGKSFDTVSTDIVSGSVYAANINASELSIAGISAQIKTVDCETDTVKITTFSGEVDISDKHGIKTLEMTTVSGALKADTGAVGSVKVTGVSGKIELVSSDTIEKLALDSISGDTTVEAVSISEFTSDCVNANVSLKLEKADFTLKFTGASKSIESNGIKYEKKDDSTYVFGSGTGNAEIKSVSGKIYVEEK